MVGLADFFTLAQQAGVFHFYLPFVLVFAIFYGLLQKSSIFGKDAMAKRLNAIISLVAALYVIGFTPVGVQLISFADYLAILFTDAAVIIVTLLVFLLFLYLVIPDVSKVSFKGWWRILILLVGLLVLAIFFNAGGGTIFGFVGNLGAGFGLTGQDIGIIILILITVAVIYWLVSGEENKKKTTTAQTD